MKARRPLDGQGRPLQPFDRTRKEWLRMGAPVELFDAEAAARAYLATHEPILGPEEGGPGPSGVYAGRYWRQHRWGWLQDHGALTVQEVAAIARDPRRFRR